MKPIRVPTLAPEQLDALEKLYRATRARGRPDLIPRELHSNEQGLEDTVRMNSNEVLDLALRFGPCAGRFMNMGGSPWDGN